MTSVSGSDDVYAEAMREILSGEPCRGIVTEPTRLLNHVYIGSQSNAEDLRTLRRIGVTHVLNCAGYKGPRPYPNASPYQGLGIEYYEFQAEDSDRYDITKHFTEAFEFIESARRKGGVVLVHCALGINRSAAVCLGYMMLTTRTTLLAATRILKDRRRIVLANKAFQRQLVRFARVRGLLDKIENDDGVVVDNHRISGSGRSTTSASFSSTLDGRRKCPDLDDDVRTRIDAIRLDAADWEKRYRTFRDVENGTCDRASMSWDNVDGLAVRRRLASDGYWNTADDDENDWANVGTNGYASAAGPRSGTGYYDSYVVERDVTMTSSLPDWRKSEPSPVWASGWRATTTNDAGGTSVPSTGGGGQYRSTGSATSLLGRSSRRLGAATTIGHSRSKSTSGVRGVSPASPSSRFSVGYL